MRKTIVKAMLTLAAILASTPGMAWDGSGTSASPYLIKTVSDLNTLATSVNGGTNYDGQYFQLANDITSAGALTPIGTNSNPFRGNFDGDGHTISGIDISLSSNYVGLFGYVQNGSATTYIQNLTLEGSITGAQYVGGLAGYAGSNGSVRLYIQNITNKCTVEATSTSGNAYVGGVIGYISNSYASLLCLHNQGAVTGHAQYVGGVIGYASTTYASNGWTNSGTVTGTSTVGGVAGQIWNNSYSISGLVNTGNVMGTGGAVGGIAGAATATLYKCENYGDVSSSGSQYIGGLVGNFNAGSYGYLTGFSCGNVTAADGATYVGAIAGKATSLPARSSHPQSVTVTIGSTTFSSTTDRAVGAETSGTFTEDANNVITTLDYWGGKSGTYDATLAQSLMSAASGSSFSIADAEDLAAVTHVVKLGYTLQGVTLNQTGDISLSGKQWLPIGMTGDQSSSPSTTSDEYFPFRGTYNGASHCVTNVTLSSSSDIMAYLGFFGLVGTGGKVQDLTVDGTCESTYDYSYDTGCRTGGIAARTKNATISGCTNRMAVSAKTRYVGGVVGHAYGSTISGCENQGIVSSTTQYVGGVIGAIEPIYTSASYPTTNVLATTVTGCSNRGAVTSSYTSDSQTGGIIGYNGGATTVSDCHNYAAVSSSGSNVGGIQGRDSNSSDNANTCTISNCTNEGAVNSTSYSVGGITGQLNRGTITYCENSGAISGTSYLGGIFGQAYYTSHAITVQDCTNTGNITGTAGYIGGIGGYVNISSGGSASFSRNYSSGNITTGDSQAYLGALFGYQSAGYGSITNTANYYKLTCAITVGSTTYQFRKGTKENYSLTYSTGYSGIGIGYTSSGAGRFMKDAEGSYEAKYATIPLTANGVDGEYWATYYNSEGNYTPENSSVKVYAATQDGTTLNLVEVGNRIIKAGEGVILESPSAATITLNYTTDEPSSGSYTGNVLEGVDEATAQESGYIYYVLSYENSTLGFYKYSSSNMLGAHKAFVKVSDSAAPAFFEFSEGNTNAIGEIKNSLPAGTTYYDLQGRKVAQPTKGLYIINGKKVIIK